MISLNYISVNRLNDFEFHDAELYFVSLTGDQLIVSAKLLNIHKGTVQNTHPSDMEIERAVITFHEFFLKSFEPGRTWKPDENGNWYTDEPEIIFTGADAIEKFLTALREGLTVFQFEASESGNYRIGAGNFDEPYFEVEFMSSSVSIEWDKYRKIAWYEEHQQKKN